MARIKGSSGELELAGVSAWNGTGTLHTLLLVQLHPGGLLARRNLAGTLCRQVLLRQCGGHICLHVSLPTAFVRLPGKYTSISHHCALFCTACCRRTGTYLSAGLLFPLLLVLREVLRSGGNGQSAAPMLEPMARQQGLKAHLCCGNVRFYGEDMGLSRSLTFLGKLAGAKLVGSACFYGTNPGVFRSKRILSALGVDLGDLLGGGSGELCRKIVAGDQPPLLALSG